MKFRWEILHYGNTASNAYFNHKILIEGGHPSVLPIRVFAEIHGMSKPAWEELSFVPQSADWIGSPVWKDVEGAKKLNSAFLETFLSVHFVAFTIRIRNLIAASLRSAKSLYRNGVSRKQNAGFKVRRFSRVVRPVKDLVLALRRVFLAFAKPFRKLALILVSPTTRLKSEITEIVGEKAVKVGFFRRSRAIHIFYGSSFLASREPKPQKTDLIFVEQGNLRWSSDDTYPYKSQQQRWRSAVTRGKHLWVTNLDPPSLNAATNLMPGRWAAFPHPYSFSEHGDAALDLPSREQLQKKLDAEFIIYLPSSQNWRTPHHNKGSNLAWQAFAQLRKEGAKVGLVASEWGLDLEVARAYTEQLGIEKNVLWFVPLPRVPMIQLLKQVDVCWDQFIIQGFGGVALRAVEAGTPLVGQGLSPEAQELVGFQVPWLIASDRESIFNQTVGILNQVKEIGLEKVATATGLTYHDWFYRHHSPSLVGRLQDIVFRRIKQGVDVPIAPDLWARTARRELISPGETVSLS